MGFHRVCVDVQGGGVIWNSFPVKRFIQTNDRPIIRYAVFLFS